MEPTVKIRNNTKRRYTLPARLDDDGAKFGGVGVGIDAKAELEIPRWYMSALLEERSLGLLFVQKKLEVLGEDGEPTRVKLEHVSPKKVDAPRFAAPKPDIEFPKGQTDEIRQQLNDERERRFALEDRVDDLTKLTEELRKLLESLTAPPKKDPPKSDDDAKVATPDAKIASAKKS